MQGSIILNTVCLMRRRLLSFLRMSLLLICNFLFERNIKDVTIWHKRWQIPLSLILCFSAQCLTGRQIQKSYRSHCSTNNWMFLALNCADGCPVVLRRVCRACCLFVYLRQMNEAFDLHKPFIILNAHYSQGPKGGRWKSLMLWCLERVWKKTTR